MLYSMQIPYFDFTITTKKNPFILWSSQQSINYLSISSPIYLVLLSILSKSEECSNLFNNITNKNKNFNIL